MSSITQVIAALEEISKSNDNLTATQVRGQVGQQAAALKTIVFGGNNASAPVVKHDNSDLSFRDPNEELQELVEKVNAIAKNEDLSWGVRWIEVFSVRHAKRINQLLTFEYSNEGTLQDQVEAYIEALNKAWENKVELS